MTKHLSIFLFLLGFSCVSNFAFCFEKHSREQESVDFVIEWLELIENGKDKESFILLTDTFKSSLDYEIWTELNQHSRESWGSLIEHQFTPVSVHYNSESSPNPGHYFVVTLFSMYQKMNRFQYIVLHSKNDEPFKVAQYESYNRESIE